MKWTTPGGKEIETVVANNTSLLKIRFTSGGELPPELAGFYTSEARAEKDIEVYLDKMKTKKVA